MGLDEGGVSELQIEHELQEAASFEPVAHELVDFGLAGRDLPGVETSLEQPTGGCGVP